MKRGFTLIELMIVIAVLGVVMTWMFEPIQFLLSGWKSIEREFSRQEAVTTAFYCLKTGFSGAREIVSVQENQVQLAGKEKMRISRRPDGRGVVIERASGKINLDFQEGMVLGKFVSVNQKTVQCGVLLNSARFSMYWRVGEK